METESHNVRIFHAGWGLHSVAGVHILSMLRGLQCTSAASMALTVVLDNLLHEPGFIECFRKTCQLLCVLMVTTTVQ